MGRLKVFKATRMLSIKSTSLASMIMVLLLSLTAPSGANAAIIKLTDGDTVAFAGIASKGMFSEQFSFHMTSASLVDGILLNQLINKMELSFKSVTDSVWTPIRSGITPNSFTNFTLSGAPLHSGDYLFQIAGVGVGNFAFQRGFIGALAISPAPEPETWSMLFVGSILIAYQLRRRQKALMPSLPMIA